jgi:frataxin-like iron-binding protein CyaY
MSELWTAFPATCPEHGRMHFRFETDEWICHGFDGEGCTHRVAAEWVELTVTSARMSP